MLEWTNGLHVLVCHNHSTVADWFVQWIICFGLTCKSWLSKNLTLQKQKARCSATKPALDRYATGRGIRCVILALIPQMAINKSFHQAAVGWLLQALFVLWYARGLPGLLDFALREGNCKNIWVIFWKSKKLRFRLDNCCKPWIDATGGIGLYAQTAVPAKWRGD